MSWISTYTGRHFNYADPNLDSICLLDIAHSLSQINRFFGHTNWPYSVAQHSVGASYIVPQEFALEALMHDAHEAYVNDMTSPLKHMLPDYKSIETRIEQLVRLKFGLPLKTKTLLIAMMQRLGLALLDITSLGTKQALLVGRKATQTGTIRAIRLVVVPISHQHFAGIEG
ncbi:hypothetical protein PB16LOC_04377 [Pectobacterium versatile]|uniref:HD family hydrolase n=1 Tax=Pectobacterium versatile TaxID=2488639 RepID=UPI000FAB7480|nr:HD family hydrolase [Pectobacterium versatile]RUR87587.1 hypothetical protein PB16LOC_04377 [Pectobacterium versatile]